MKDYKNRKMTDVLEDLLGFKKNGKIMHDFLDRIGAKYGFVVKPQYTYSNGDMASMFLKYASFNLGVIAHISAIEFTIQLIGYDEKKNFSEMNYNYDILENELKEAVSRIRSMLIQLEKDNIKKEFDKIK